MRSDDDSDTEQARDEDGQIYVDRDKIDFDPDDGLLAGTAVDGTSDIPGSPSNPDGDNEQTDQPAGEQSDDGE